jgi:DNA-binding NtrC family response regulator
MGKRIIGLTPAAVALLAAHDWPGNVRELRNVMERATINAESPLIDTVDLSSRLQKDPRSRGWRASSSSPSASPSSSRERQLVEEALSILRQPPRGSQTAWHHPDDLPQSRASALRRLSAHRALRAQIRAVRATRSLAKGLTMPDRRARFDHHPIGSAATLPGRTRS